MPRATPTTDLHVRTLSQSAILTALRQLRNQGEMFFSIHQILAAMPPRWRTQREQTYRTIDHMIAIGFLERGQSNLKHAGEYLAGFRLTPLGVSEHDRFLSVVADQIERCNAPAPGRVAA